MQALPHTHTKAQAHAWEIAHWPNFELIYKTVKGQKQQECQKEKRKQKKKKNKSKNMQANSYALPAQRELHENRKRSEPLPLLL